MTSRCFSGPEAESYESPNIAAGAAEPFPTGSLAVGDANCDVQFVYPTSEEVGHPSLLWTPGFMPPCGVAVGNNQADLDRDGPRPSPEFDALRATA